MSSLTFLSATSLMALSSFCGIPTSLATWSTPWFTSLSAVRSTPSPGWASCPNLFSAAPSTLSMRPDMNIRWGGGKWCEWVVGWALELQLEMSTYIASPGAF
ncbi:hypothetical protein C8F04DRAFT_1104560 [Mycena alexandri]|uniref:Secreted protein n=1 Tax=Mycena alexandri TaxID=1745969 RepID=A0AAD6WZK9_9AGAR|nr:hypothetical protein C8F04DRAFT_1104560 [Mycena alexandri]